MENNAFEKFCENYIEAAETEWEKYENEKDLSNATVAKIFLTKYRACKPDEAKAEPLAVLADRKGLEISKIASYAYPVGWLIHFKQQSPNTYDWGGVYEIPDKDTDNVYTYALAETKAREFLNGLADKEEK